jgi:Tol biopolymer transport system component/predicted Ser/Thr protein kinase
MIAPGTKFGPYEIISFVAKGGMGEVYRARDTRLGRTVAIKVLPAADADPEVRTRFEREARAISSLSHPNICPLYDVGSHNGIEFLVMEYLEGETLAERLKRGALPLELLLTVAGEIADALDRAHDQGLIHRDLKPGNIMLTKSGAKLLDFGLARRLEDAGSPMHEETTGLTRAGRAVGTPGYMSPEQVEGKEADARSDLFAFGSVLYEMATGRRPFAGDTHRSTASAILTAEPAPLRQFRGDAPAALERLVSVCLAKNPDDRWRSAHDIKLQLQWMREASSVTAEHAPRTRGKLLGWVFAAVFFAVSGGLIIDRTARVPEPVPFRRASLLPPEGIAFAPFNFAVSPDGSRLAFVGIGADGRDTLWVRALDSRMAQQINGSERAAFPFWAPDSRRIGFFVPGKLNIADTSTGAVQTLCDAFAGHGGTWNRQGLIVFAPALAGTLMRVSENGGRPEPATTVDPDSPQAHRWPWFLPDGRRFLYMNDWSVEGNPHRDGIYVGSLDGGESRLLLTDVGGNVAYASGHLLYFREGSLIAREFDPERLAFKDEGVPILVQELRQDSGFRNVGFSVSNTGVLAYQSVADSASQLVWYDRSGKELGILPAPEALGPDISPDGNSVVFSSNDERNSRQFVRVFDLSRSVGTRLSNEGWETSPAWSRDSHYIFYASKHGTREALYRVRADGSRQPELLFEGQRLGPNDVAPDGGAVLCMNFAHGMPFLSLFDPATAAIRDLDARAEGQISPNGNWLSYTDQPSEIYVRPLAAAGAKVQVSNGGGCQARWGRNGQHLFYVAPDRKLMEVPIEERDGRLIVGVPRPLFQTRIISPRFVLFQYDVSPKMDRFLINSLRPDSPLTLISNWTSHHK